MVNANDKSSISQVAELLDQASRLLRQAEQNNNINSVRSNSINGVSSNYNNNINSGVSSNKNSNNNYNNSVSSNNNDIQHVLGSARNMLRSANSGGLFSRLNRTERLRASSHPYPYNSTTGPNRRLSTNNHHASSSSSGSASSSSRQRKPAEKHLNMFFGKVMMKMMRKMYGSKLSSGIVSLPMAWSMFEKMKIKVT